MTYQTANNFVPIYLAVHGYKHIQKIQTKIMQALATHTIPLQTIFCRHQTQDRTLNKMINNAHRQIGDQTTKGGLLGIMIYAMSRNNVDPVLIGLIVPVAASVLAWVSTKIGNPDLACMFIPDDKDKQ